MKYDDLPKYAQENIDILVSLDPNANIAVYAADFYSYSVCYCSENPDFDDIAEDLEDTLDTLLDNGYSDDAIESILGACKMTYDEENDEFIDEDGEVYGEGDEFTYVDKDYVIPGLLCYFEAVTDYKNPEDELQDIFNDIANKLYLSEMSYNKENREYSFTTEEEIYCLLGFAKESNKTLLDYLNDVLSKLNSFENHRESYETAYNDDYQYYVDTYNDELSDDEIRKTVDADMTSLEHNEIPDIKKEIEKYINK